MAAETIYEMLIRHEGLRLKPYRDTQGKLTLGVGRNLDDVGITTNEAFALLANDVSRVRKGLDKYLSWWREVPEPAGLVLQNMAFQMGITGLLRFERFLGALRRNDYPEAAREMLDSDWAKQTPNRVRELVGIVAVQARPTEE